MPVLAWWHYVHDCIKFNQVTVNFLAILNFAQKLQIFFYYGFIKILTLYFTFLVIIILLLFIYIYMRVYMYQFCNKLLLLFFLFSIFILSNNNVL